eukprot:3532455-Rhodomonas_salina.1
MQYHARRNQLQYTTVCVRFVREIVLISRCAWTGFPGARWGGFRIAEYGASISYGMCGNELAYGATISLGTCTELAYGATQCAVLS